MRLGPRQRNRFAVVEFGHCGLVAHKFVASSEVIVRLMLQWCANMASNCCGAFPNCGESLAGSWFIDLDSFASMRFTVMF